MLRQGGIRPALGFLGEPPREPDHLVHRAEPLAALSQALRARAPAVAITGPTGVGKSTLAALACRDRQVRRAFRDGIAWLAAGSQRAPVLLLDTLAGQLRLSLAAAGFAAVEPARDELARALRGKRVLIVLDDVTERSSLDACLGLAPDCTVLFTSRLTGLPGSVGAVHVPLGPLHEQQAQELLRRWAGLAPASQSGDGQSGDGQPRADQPRADQPRADQPRADQPRADQQSAARALCDRVGRLALGVAVAGGMTRGGHSLAQTLASIGEPTRPAGSGAEPAAPGDEFPHLHRSLLRAIEAAVAGLPELYRDRYQQLAVFAGRGPFPTEAAQALWPPALPAGAAPGLLAEFCHRALLSRTGPNHYIAQQPHYEVLQSRLGPDGLAAAHGRLLAGYRERYPAGWAYSAADPYLARHLAGHLHDAGLGDELHDLLTDAGWIQARLSHGPVPDLIHDYRYARDPLTRQILRTLRLCRTVFAADPGLVPSQLISRLAGYPDPGIAAWAASLARRPVNGHDAHGLGPVRLIRTAAPPASQRSQGRQVGAGQSGPVRTVAVTPDGARAVSGGEDGAVRVWDLGTGQQQAALTGHTDWVRAVAVTADGTQAVSGGDDGTVRVWDLATGQQQGELAGHDRPVWAVAVTPDGTRAVSGGGDGTVRVWDLAAGQPRGVLTGHTGEVFAVALTADRDRAVSGGSDGTVRVWDLADGRATATLTGHHGWVWSAAVTPDEALAVSAGEDGTVRVWDLASGRAQAARTGHAGQVFAVALTPDAALAVSGGADGTVRAWDLATGRPAGPGGASQPAGWVFSVALTRDGRQAVSGSDDGTLRVWDLAAGQPRAVLTGHSRPVWAVAVTPDGTRAVSGSSDRTLRVWDLAAGQPRAVLTGHSRPVWAVAVTPDGTRAVSGSSDRTIRVWDLAVGRPQAVLAGHLHPVFAVAVTPDGTRAVSGSLDELRVWDLAGRRELAALTGHTGEVFAVAVTPDGRRAVSGGSDRTVRVWDLATGQQQAVLEGHTQAVFAVAVTPDGAHVVTGGADGSVRAWDLAAGAEVAMWTADHPVIGCAALPGPPVTIGVGQALGPPVLLELRGPRAG